MAARPDKHVAVMLDTKGPEIRTGTLEASLNGKITLKKGQLIEVGTDYAKPGNTEYLRKTLSFASSLSLSCFLY